MSLTQDQRDELDRLKLRFERAETGDQHAELCRQEQVILHGRTLYEPSDPRPHSFFSQSAVASSLTVDRTAAGANLATPPAAASPIAIRREDALSWHHATQLVAGIAQRAGYRIRALPGQGWHVWATDGDYGELVIQAAGEKS